MQVEGHRSAPRDGIAARPRGVPPVADDTPTDAVGLAEVLSDGREAQFAIGFASGHAADGLFKQGQQLAVAAVVIGELPEDIQNDSGRHIGAQQFDLGGLLLAHLESAVEGLDVVQAVDLGIDQVKQAQESSSRRRAWAWQLAAAVRACCALPGVSRRSRSSLRRANSAIRCASSMTSRSG